MESNNPNSMGLKSYLQRWIENNGSITLDTLTQVCAHPDRKHKVSYAERELRQLVSEGKCTPVYNKKKTAIIGWDKPQVKRPIADDLINLIQQAKQQEFLNNQK